MVVRFFSQRKRPGGTGGDTKAAAAGTTAAHGLHLPGIQNMENQTLRLALLQDGQSLIGADVARHFVFHVIIGKDLKLQTRFEGMFASLSIQAYGFAAKALGDGNTRFAFDDGRRVIVLGIGKASACLAENDAYHFFEDTGCLFKTGPTYTNVCDIQILAVV